MTSSNTFRALHYSDAPLLLPNAWDPGSARLIESLGARAIATTSAGLAWSRGYPDGDALPIEQLLATARDIVRVISVPLTVDIEGGYSSDPAVVAQVVRGIIDVGAVGINLEDGAGAPEMLCAKIEAARQTAARAGVDLFINARTDVYLRAFAKGDAAVEEVVRRAERYQSAGCDGIFVPAITDSQAIRAVAAAIAPLPLNIMLMPGLSPVSELCTLGVRRISAGAALAQASLSLTSQLASQFINGSWDNMFSLASDYNATNQLFRRE